MARKSSYELLKKLAINSSSVTGAAAFLNAQQNSDIGSFYDADVKINEAIALGDSTKIADALAINSSITPQSNISQNQKSLNEVYFKYLSSESSLTSADFVTLQSIAQLCPFEDGTSVYQARALLSRYDTTVYENSCELNVSSQRLAETFVGSAEKSHDVMVHPNPTNGDIKIVGDVAGARFVLFNVLGQVLMETELSSNSLITLETLKDGTYLYKIIKENRIIKTDKILIKH